MKSGIYLGPPVGHARRAMWSLIALGVLATLLHAALYLRQRVALETLRSEVRRQESFTNASPSENTDTDRVALDRLRAFSRSGLSESLPPTELLNLLMEALPDEVAVVGVSVELSSNPQLLVDGIATRQEGVTELQKRVAAAPEVIATNLLEERRGPDGNLFVRLQVELARGHEP